MALPQQVIDRLSRENPETPGWSLGLLTFSAGILFIALVIYFGLTFGYEPYLASQIDQLNGQVSTLAKSISPDDQAKFVALYSEIVNLKSTLGSHVFFSHFLSWLEANTEANVYYTNLSFSSGRQITLAGVGATEADVNQQVAIFEAAPAVAAVNLSSVTLTPTTGTWRFNVMLTMDPAVLHS